MSKVTDCCGVPPRSNGDNDTEDMGVCPRCHEYCEYVFLEYCSECEQEIEKNYGNDEEPLCHECFISLKNQIL